MEGDQIEQDTVIQQGEEEEITDAEISALIERIDALAARLGEFEQQLTGFTGQLTGYDGRFAEFDTRLAQAQPGERHWYFKKVKNEIE